MVHFEFLDFPHLGQTSPQVLQPSAPGTRAKATGQACGGKKNEEKRANIISAAMHKSPIAQRFLLKCSSATLCFRCFFSPPFLATSSREPALKWMIACDRRIKSINPTLIKRGMMN